MILATPQVRIPLLFLDPVRIYQRGVDSGGEDGDIEIVASSQSPRKTSAGRNNAKKRENALLVTLVHGDILMLSGDDFEVGFNVTTFTTMILISPSAR